MIFRKPYAFLIKNFKKIHIFLLILSLYIAYKLVDVNLFLNEFMQYGTYDYFSNPITNHITFWLKLALFMVMIGSAALLVLLYYKKKPWKIYLIPIVEYLLLFFVLSMVSSFFGGYSSDVETTDLRLSRDLLLIFLLGQLPAIAVFVMRVFGLDMRKFQFNTDEEFLQLSEEDREEFEVNFNIDYYSFKRTYRKFIRNVNYFYTEHKKICKSIIALFVVFFIFQIYKFTFVTHKTYKEGSNYDFNGYTIKINNSYFTDKDYIGNVISKKSNFVILDLTVINHAAPRKLVIENFHLKNGTSDFVTTEKTYAKEFQDLGNTYEKVKELKRDESFNFIIVYKVDKKLKSNKFNLYYQENNYLRKIKLNVKDISKIEELEPITLGNDMVFSLNDDEQDITFDYFEFYDTLEYSIRTCTVSSCNINKYDYASPPDKKVLKIDFSSNSFEGKDMVDFSNDYGKIIYVDNSNGEDEEVELEFYYPFTRTATGKYLYTLVPKEVENSSILKIVYVVRNKKYVYKLI